MNKQETLKEFKEVIIDLNRTPGSYGIEKYCSNKIKKFISDLIDKHEEEMKKFKQGFGYKKEKE